MAEQCYNEDMKKFLTPFLIALIAMLCLDVLWIGFIAASFYKVEMGAYYSSTPLLWPAAIFYVLYVCGLVHFVIQPALRSGSVSTAAAKGAFFAAVAFGTYDLTALSVIPHWPVILSAVDMAWGTFEGMLVCAITYLITKSVTHSPR